MINFLISQTKNKLTGYSLQIVSQLDFISKCLETMDNAVNFNGWVAYQEGQIIALDDKMSQSFICIKIENGWQVYVHGTDSTWKSNIIKELQETINIDDAPYLFDSFLCSFKNNDGKHFFIPAFSGHLGKFNDLLNCLNFYTVHLQKTTHLKMDVSFETDSHDYQLKSNFFKVYSDDKMSFYHTAFMITGSGFYWDENGNLTCGNTAFYQEIENIDIEDIPEGSLEGLYPSLNDNNLLNMPENATKEWKNAKKQFVRQLKNLANEVPKWEKNKQDNFFGLTDGTVDFTLEDLKLMIAKL